MEIIKPKAAAEIIGTSYRTVMNYCERWPWLRWKSGPGDRVPTWMPRPAVILCELIRQGYDAGLSDEEIDVLLSQIDYERALGNEGRGERRGHGYPETLVRQPTSPGEPQIIFAFDEFRCEVEAKFAEVPLGEDRIDLAGSYQGSTPARGAMTQQWLRWRRAMRDRRRRQ